MQKHHVWLALVRLPNDANSRKVPGASGVASSNMLHPSLKLSTSIECTSGLFDGSRAIRITSDSVICRLDQFDDNGNMPIHF
jgi:hypothetical protein